MLVLNAAGSGIPHPEGPGIAIYDLETRKVSLGVRSNFLRHASLRVTTDVYMQAVGPQKREAQGNLVRLVRKGAVLAIKPA